MGLLANGLARATRKFEALNRVRTVGMSLSIRTHLVPDKGRFLVSAEVVLSSLNILSDCVSLSPSIPTSGLPESLRRSDVVVESPEL